MQKIIVVCPKGHNSGGPEALHQLARELRNFHQYTYLWDPDPIRIQNLPNEAFLEYGDLWIDTSPLEGDIVILPEVMSHLIPIFYDSNVLCFWWLSVDNYEISKKIPIELIRELYPEIIHLYQSEYANVFLDQNKIFKKFHIGDYINSEFFYATDVSDKVKISKQDLPLKVAINPAKGFNRSKLLIEKFQQNEIVYLQGMSRFEVIEQLRKAHFYVDLGEHPGMDRFPREASLLDCIVLTNTRGAAANDFDIPIDSSRFKFDETSNDSTSLIYKTIKLMYKNFEENLKLQNGYRKFILDQKNKFEIDVKVFYNFIKNCAMQPKLNNSYFVRNFIRSLFIDIEKLKLLIQNSLDQNEIINRQDIEIQNLLKLIEENKIEIIKQIEAKKILEEKLDEFSRKYLEIQGSLSWKFTKPIRKLIKVLKIKS